MLRLTRRNLLVVLLSISVFGLFVYSKIGSRVTILRGTTLTLGRGGLERSTQDGGNQPPRDVAWGENDDAANTRSLSQEQVRETEDDTKTSESESDEHEDDPELDGEFMMREGFIGEGEVGQIKEAEEGVDGDSNGEDAGGRGVARVPEPDVRKSTKNHTDDKKEPVKQVPPPHKMEVIEEDAVNKHGVENLHHPHKSRVVKIGWTRDRAERRPPLNRTSMSQNVTEVPISSTVITSHYFVENPLEAPRANKLFRKCLSKMTELERRYFAEWEVRYRKTLPSDIHPFTIGQRWISLSRYMQSVGREQRLPDVLNIGAKKSGTTALGWFLSMHPQISHSFGNEVHFFDKQYEKGLDYYRARMNFAKRNQLVFEKTPRYLVTDSAPGHALQDLPRHVKFIICIRDPLKRALSDFRHDSTIQVRRQAKMNPKKITAARTPEGEGARFAAGAFDAKGNVNSSFDSVRTSSYVKHFRNWLSYFPRDRFLIVDHQRLVDDAFHELHRIEAFLGLSPYFQPSMFYFDRNRKGTCMRGRQSPCPPRSSPGFLPAGQLIPDQERKLRDYFRPLNREFVELVGPNNFTWVDL